MKSSRRTPSASSSATSDSLRVAALPGNLSSVAERTSTSTPPPSTPAINNLSASSEDIALRAYQHWERSGGGHGEDQSHWYAAEQELRNPRERSDDSSHEGNLPDPETRREMS